VWAEEFTGVARHDQPREYQEQPEPKKAARANRQIEAQLVGLAAGGMQAAARGMHPDAASWTASRGLQGQGPTKACEGSLLLARHAGLQVLRELERLRQHEFGAAAEMP
jgi:hypothetical protein